MLNEQRSTASARSRRTRNNNNNNISIHQDDNNDADHEPAAIIRDIHALTPPSSRQVSSSLSMASSSDAAAENFTTISREFNALVLAGSTIRTDQNQSGPGPTNLGRIGEDRGSPEMETNPLAIVVDPNPLQSPPRDSGGGGRSGGGQVSQVTVQRVKKEEAETKISAWQNAKIAKVNNRFKRDEAIINGWEDKQVHKASSWMKNVERKLEEKRAKAVEKMQNDIAKAHRKAEERKASAEAKRGTKIAK
ncbi:Remorin family protein, partial [Perilla frutescens var. hirtella]